MSFPIQQGLFKYNLEDHYAILGVPLGADAKQIRSRYLKIAYRLHPDTCKAKSPSDRNWANKVLSKLVNPAYEILSKDQSRAEYYLVLSQTGKNLAQKIEQISLVTDLALQLLKADHNTDLIYHRLLRPIINQQYDSFEQLFTLTAQLSELNLVYLMLKRGENALPKSPTPAIKHSDIVKPPASSVQHPSASQAADLPEDKAQSTPLDNALLRAQDQMARKNYSQAIAELREALKLDPNHSTSHSLIGIAYLRQNQITMAKIHVNKAIAANPYDPIVVKAKQELAAASPKEPEKDESKKGFLGGMFGAKKN
jgi:curved DNA-binding protein CbpA